MDELFAMLSDGANMIQEVPDWLMRRALTDGSKEALRFTGSSVTYEALSHAAAVFAAACSINGITVGQRVAVLIRGGRDYALAVHGLMRTGVVMVPLNWRLTANELVWQVDDVKADWLLYDAPAEEEAVLISRKTGVSVLCIHDLLKDDSEPAHVSETLIDLQRPLAVIYTSGTTGRPKGTLLTYGNFWWSAMASALQFGLHKDDQWLVPMPLFHVGGLSVLLRSLIYGTTAVIHDRFDAKQVNRTIDEEGITLLSVVPTMLSRMLEERGERAYPSRLRLVLLGGSSASKSLLEQSIHLGVPVAQSYGLTEACSQVATLLPEDGLRKLGSSGRPLFQTQIRIIRAASDEDIAADVHSPLPVGEMGQIAVQGPTVTPGYLNRPEVNAKRFVAGWFLTGDIGYLDGEGYLYVVDRRSDLIVSGGENIYPAEVEQVLMMHPNVLEAGVVGAEDPVWGQVPVAVVRTKEGARVPASDLTEHCRRHLAGYKVPRTFHQVLDPLPRNASGKLLRKDLRIQVAK